MSWVDEVKRRVDILVVAQRFTKLRQAGNTWRGPCPLHGGQKDNFVVYAERGTYKCFVCNQGGDAFSLLEAMEGLSFIDTAKELACSLGIEVSRGGETSPQGNEEEQRKSVQRWFRDAEDGWWVRHVGEDGARMWGLGARRAGDSVVGTVPLWEAGTRTPVGWLCYLEGEEDTLQYLGLAPESMPDVKSGIAAPSDLANSIEKFGVLGVFGSPIEAMSAWNAGGRSVVSLGEPLVPGVLPARGSIIEWWNGIGVESVWWGLPVETLEDQRAAFQMEVECVAAGFAPLVAGGSLSVRRGLDLAAGIGEALARYDDSVAKGVMAEVVDLFQWRGDMLRARYGNPVHASVLSEHLGPTIRAAYGRADHGLFHLYTAWAYRLSGEPNMKSFVASMMGDTSLKPH